MLNINDSFVTSIERWFIPIDLLMIICTLIVIIFSLVFSLIIFLNKGCRTVSMILICNSFISEILFSSVMFSMALFTFKNDLKKIKFEDSLCIFRGYMSYATSSIRSHSYLLQSLYRYITVIYPSNMFYQTIKFQIYLICSIWIISFIHPFPFLFTNKIKYNVDNQVCHMPYQTYLFIFYTCFLSYLNPIIIIIIIYFKLVRYVQQMNKNITPVNQYLRIQRELKMVRQIVMLIIILVILGLPYTIFYLISFFRNPPKYHFRIAFLFVDLSLVCVIISLLKFTNPIKKYFIKKINKFTNTLTQPNT